VRVALGALLLFLPFQPLAWRLVSAHPHVAAGVRWVDELALAFFLPWALRAWARRGRPLPPGGRAVGIALAAFGAACLLSALLNAVDFLPAVLGTFDYVKGVAWLFVFAALCADRDWLRKVYRMLFVVALAGALCAVGQEVLGQPASFHVERRLGILRVPAFFCHPNALGLYLLLFFLVEAARGTGPWRPLALFVGLALSVSRMVHTAAAVLLVPLVRRRRFLIAPLIVSGFIAIALTGSTVREYGVTAATYRAYGMEKGLEVWRDHQVFGAGPGRFGGVVSVVTGSPLYERYPWEPKWLDFLLRLRSLDQLAPQLLAELGVVGTVAFVALYLTILRALWLARGTGELGPGLLLAALAIPFYVLGSGLHFACFLVTLVGLAGAHLGLAAAREREQEPL
jgi:hypothetical protein